MHIPVARQMMLHLVSSSRMNACSGIAPYSLFRSYMHSLGIHSYWAFVHFHSNIHMQFHNEWIQVVYVHVPWVRRYAASFRSPGQSHSIALDRTLRVVKCFVNCFALRRVTMAGPAQRQILAFLSKLGIYHIPVRYSLSYSFTVTISFGLQVSDDGCSLLVSYLYS